MATHSTSKSAALVPAVAYLRRSTHKQEKSLTDQRREIERYAKQQGYRIVRWFQDDGISGDATEKRSDFQAMHHAATNGRDFEVILCWDQDRFGRFNSIEAGYWIHPLMKAGVRLETVTEGPVNWNDFSGRIVHAVKQEGKHQFLVDLSRNTARGQITNARSGHLCGQAAPYGYDRMLVNESGVHQQRVHNGEQFAKHRSWHVTLVPSDDPEKVRVAKWLFETYANLDVSLRSLASQLNEQGIPSPRGGRWGIGTIREILRNEAYIGVFVWAKRRLGKYHRVSGEDIKPRNGDARVVVNEEAERIIVKDAHPALVENEVFQSVQEKLHQRRLRTTPSSAKNDDRYLLSGLVICGHCGNKMYGVRHTRKKDGKTYAYERYLCSGYHKRTSDCGHHTVDQAAMLALLLEKLREVVLGQGDRDQLRERIVDRLHTAQDARPADLKSLQTRLAELDKQLTQGTKRLLLAPDEIADLLGKELANVRRDRDRTAKQLESLQPPDADLEAEADAVMDQLWAMGQELEQASPARLRELFRRMVSRIELRFGQEQWGRKTVNPFETGTIDFRTEPHMSTLVSRGDRI